MKKVIPFLVFLLFSAHTPAETCEKIPTTNNLQISTVRVWVYKQGEEDHFVEGGGLITSDGKVFTNRHVVEEPNTNFFQALFNVFTHRQAEKTQGSNNFLYKAVLWDCQKFPLGLIALSDRGDGTSQNLEHMPDTSFAFDRSGS